MGLVEAVLKLKKLLGIDGAYSICRTDGTPMGLGDLMIVGDALEELDSALVSYQEFINDYPIMLGGKRVNKEAIFTNAIADDGVSPKVRGVKGR